MVLYSFNHGWLLLKSRSQYSNVSITLFFSCQWFNSWPLYLTLKSQDTLLKKGKYKFKLERFMQSKFRAVVSWVEKKRSLIFDFKMNSSCSQSLPWFPFCPGCTVTYGELRERLSSETRVFSNLVFLLLGVLVNRWCSKIENLTLAASTSLSHLLQLG